MTAHSLRISKVVDRVKISVVGLNRLVRTLRLRVDRTEEEPEMSFATRNCLIFRHLPRYGSDIQI